MRQIDGCNMDRTEVLLGKDKVVKLRELLPHPVNEVLEGQRGSLT